EPVAQDDREVAVQLGVQGPVEVGPARDHPHAPTLVEVADEGVWGERADAQQFGRVVPPVVHLVDGQRPAGGPRDLRDDVDAGAGLVDLDADIRAAALDEAADIREGGGPGEV